MTAPSRFVTLDALRGIAVMGILLMNIIGFSMPEAAYLNPLAWGGKAPADLAAWAASFVLIDGKMRGLFSLLFGASMLLVIERAAAAGEDDGKVHRRRMVWLLIFGLIHHYLIWFGDILVPYAVAGFVAMVFVYHERRSLIRWSAILFAVNFLFYAVVVGSMIMLQLQATSDPAAAASYADLAASIGGSIPALQASEVATYRSGYLAILTDRFTQGLFRPITATFFTGIETLALMLLGMALLKNGFLTGAWERARYRRLAIRCYALGLPPMILLAWWCFASGFDPVTTFGAMFAWSAPFRILLTLGHAALAMLLILRFARSALVIRIAAAGRAAFTNYLGTSLLMTTIFYGYGFGLFGTVDRAPVYLFVLGGWIVMLAWSKPWFDRFAYGPLEWLWRSLARGSPQPFRAIL